MAKPYLDKAVTSASVDKKAVAALLQPRCELLSDIPEQVDFFDRLPDYDTELYCHKKMKTNKENSLISLNAIFPALEGLSDWTQDALHAALFAIIEQMGVKNGVVLWPLRVAVSGKAFTPGGGIELALLLGKEETLARVKRGIELLS